MEYGNAIVQHFRRQMSSKHAGEDKVLQTRIGQMTFAVELLDSDKFSFVLSSIKVWREGKQNLQFQKLRNRAEEMPGRMTYLSEELVVAEADEINCRLQLRSRRPAPASFPFSYYEIELKSSRAVNLSRWEYPKIGVQRVRSSFGTTDQILGALANDLAFAVME